jgi:hypothetical protein
MEKPITWRMEYFQQSTRKKKDGVQPEFDIRTDRFEVAIDAIDKINQSTANQIAKNKGETEAVKDFETGVKTDPEKS